MSMQELYTLWVATFCLVAWPWELLTDEEQAQFALTAPDMREVLGIKNT